jgi:hypothetical protein
MIGRSASASIRAMNANAAPPNASSTTATIAV